jgi:hypothetical protein
VFRVGVPQSRHIHTLLMRGRQILDQLLPGLGVELADQGATTIEWPADVLWLSEAGWGARFRSGLTSLGCSRELLEWVVRRRVLALGRVRFVQGREVVGLIPADGGRAVAGVELRSRGREGPTVTSEPRLLADLVVDASGRESRVPDWLSRLGYPRPDEWSVDRRLRDPGRRRRMAAHVELQYPSVEGEAAGTLGGVGAGPPFAGY